MKKIKQTVALALALVMTLAMSITVFADDPKTYSITIRNAVAGHTYEAYQIIKGDLSGDGNTLSNVDWGTGIDSSKTSTLNTDAKTYVESLSNMQDNSKKLKAEAQKIGAILSSTATGSVTVNEKNIKNAKIDNLQPGYYLVRDAANSLTGNDAYTEYILNIVGNTTITPKTDVPSVEKKVKDINDTTGTETEWQDSADYDIGDKVPFQLTATLPDNVESYKTYFLQFNDTLSDGLDYVTNSISIELVKNDGGKKTNITNNFSVDYKNHILTISCNNILQEGIAAKNSDKIVVEYKATLNNSAVIGSKGNPNTVNLEFSNNPNNGGESDKGKTPDDKVIVFTYKVVIKKVDKDKLPLKGAEFTLYKKINDQEDKKITTVATGEDQNIFEFKGLDDGDYVLKETKTPDGYNTIADQYFTISATHDFSDNPTLTEFSGNATYGQVCTITFTSNTDDGSLTADVINNKGSVLPSTGGAGRVAIYVIGAILVIGGGIVLVTKRRVRE